MNKRLIFYLLLALLIGWLIYYKIHSATKAPAGPAPGAPNGPSNVNAVIIKAKTLDNIISSSGTVIANEEAELRSEISGKITHIYFHEGSLVRKGELLVKINDADLQAQMQKSVYMRELAQQKVERQKKLLSINGISQEEYDMNLNNLNTIKSDIELYNAQIAKTEIRAPFDGTIGLKSISEGNFVNSNTLIASIQQLQPVKIDFSIPEKYLGMFDKGTAVIFTVQGSDKIHNAEIYAVEPKVDLNTRSIKVRAIYTNSGSDVSPGAFAEVKVSLNKIENAIMIPTEAVIPELKSEKAFISKNGKSFPQKIKTGIRNDTQVQILDGIREGDTVITTGIMGLKPGATLKFLSIKRED